jgi:hypothetical protein
MPEETDDLSQPGETTERQPADPKQEEAYWREHHHKQPFAEKSRGYEDYAAAYRTGYEGVNKYAGKNYDDVEDSLAQDYERSQPGAAIPWDTVRPAVKAAWDKLVISPREPSRGVRGFI